MADALMQLVAGTTPVVIDETREFWVGTTTEELRVHVCNVCGHAQLPGGPCCRECLSPETRWERSKGRGVVFSFTIVRHAFHPSFADKVPYVVADIQLHEGPIFTSTVTDVDAAAVTIGMPVEVWFDEQTTDAFGVALRLPKFKPAKD